MADDESTRGNDDTPPADPKEGSSKGTEHKKEQSLTPQDTEAIDGLFKRLKESGAIPVNRLTINNLSVINLPPCGPSASATARFSLNSAVYQRQSIHSSLYTSTQLTCALRQHPAFVHLPTTLPSIVHFSLVTSILHFPTQPTQVQHWAIPSH